MHQKSLKLIKYSLKRALPLLDIQIYTPTSNPNMRSLTGLTNLKKAVNLLSDTGLFQKQIDEVFLHTIYVNSITDSAQATHQETKLLVKDIDSLRYDVSIILSAIEQQIPDEDSDSINIKMPKEVNDLASLSKVCVEFDKIFNQLFVNDTINGQQKIVSVENGSIWINLLIGNAATRLIGKVTWAAAVIFNKITEVRANQEFNRGLKLKNDALDEIIKLHKLHIDQLIAAEAELIANEEFANNVDKNEYIQRLKMSIKELSDLIFRGAEIRPAISAPEQVSNLFPEFPKLIGVSSKIKEIESPDKK